jgi:uncharacterized membrane protein
MTSDTHPQIDTPLTRRFHLPGTAQAEHLADIARHHHQIAEVKAAPEAHEPRLVVTKQVTGGGILNYIADAVNRFCGSMFVFLFITIAIVAWLFLGNFVGFDKTPWPLLLTILNLPQLSIMVSLQVSANRSQAASDARALADHETLVALHTLSTKQLDILDDQNKILGILDDFASKDMPAQQQDILQTAQAILAAVRPTPA